MTYKYRPAPSNWTGERIELLKTLVAGNKHSAREIATELGGVTRNAVIGKIDRLGLTKVRKPAAGRKPREKRSIRKNGQGYVPLNPGDELDAAPNFNSLQELEAEPAPTTFLGIPLLKLEHHHCRYPRDVDGKTLFCGQPKMESSSYCAACHKRCHSRATYRLNMTEAHREQARQQGLRNIRKLNAKHAGVAL